MYDWILLISIFAFCLFSGGYKDANFSSIYNSKLSVVLHSKTNTITLPNFDMTSIDEAISDTISPTNTNNTKLFRDNDYMKLSYDKYWRYNVIKPSGNYNLEHTF